MHNCYLQQGGFCRSVDLLASRISQKLRDRSQQNCVGGWNGPRKNEIDEGILIKGDCQHCLSAGPEYKSLEWHFWYCFSVVRVSTHRLRECSLMPLRNVGWMCRLECHCGCLCVPLKTKNQKNVLYNKCFCQSIGKKRVSTYILLMITIKMTWQLHAQSVHIVWIQGNSGQHARSSPVCFIST